MHRAHELVGVPPFRRRDRQRVEFVQPAPETRRHHIGQIDIVEDRVLPGQRHQHQADLFPGKIVVGFQQGGALRVPIAVRPGAVEAFGVVLRTQLDLGFGEPGSHQFAQAVVRLRPTTEHRAASRSSPSRMAS